MHRLRAVFQNKQLIYSAVIRVDFLRMSLIIPRVIFEGGKINEEEVEIIRKVKYLVEEEKRDINETHLGVCRVKF